jgi:sugar-specific transcriptional regulator TrmB
MEIEETKYLNSLGLTEYEAKALVSLIKKNSLEAPEISSITGIPKTRVYDVLEKLEKKALVISLEGRPKKYQAIEKEKIIEKLLQEKKKEFKEIEENAIKLKQILSAEEKEEKENIIKVKQLSDFNRILGKEILKAKKSVIGFTELKEKNSFLEEALNAVTENKVKVKLISSKKEAEWLHKKISIKSFNHSLNAFVIDEKKVILGLNSLQEKKPHYHFAILHNKSLAEAISNHFNEKWNK